MKGFSICNVASLAALAFGYEYAYTSAKDLSKTPCDSMRKGREAAIGRDKDIYECIFDEQDSIYLWAGEDDTLTAVGREFHRAESSSSSRHSGLDPESSSSKGDGESLSSSSGQAPAAMTSSSYSSSSSMLTSFSSMAIPFSVDSKEDFFNSSIDYGTLIDERDGKTYKTVIIGDRVWMAENLNFADVDAYPILEGHSYCFNNQEDNCDLMGRLYDRAAAMNSASCDYEKYCDLGDTAVRGLCPDGWHIPTEQEATYLRTFVGGDFSAAISTKGWNSSIVGSNTSGFSLVGSGNLSGDRFVHAGQLAMVWYYVADESQWYLVLEKGRPHLQEYTSEKEYVSIRCVKDGVVPSSSSESSSSSSRPKQEDAEPLLDKGTQFNSEITYGTMTDSRDSKTYKTVEIDGKTWMAENLNYAGNEIGESFCFNDEDRFCDIYGRLYSRDAAMNDARCDSSRCELGDAPIQGICPNGWHIPSEREMIVLAKLVNKDALPLMSAEGWADTIKAGTNTLGLSLIGAGSYDSKSYFRNLGVDTFLWLYYTGDQKYLLIRGSDSYAEGFVYTYAQMYISVRCVKDE